MRLEQFDPKFRDGRCPDEAEARDIPPPNLIVVRGAVNIPDKRLSGAIAQTGTQRSMGLNRRLVDPTKHTLDPGLCSAVPVRVFLSGNDIPREEVIEDEVGIALWIL